MPSPDTDDPGGLRGRLYLLVTLGCFRNEVESDLLRGSLQRLGLAETTRIEDADVALVMTCGFIREATCSGCPLVRSKSVATSVVVPTSTATSRRPRPSSCSGACRSDTALIWPVRCPRSPRHSARTGSPTFKRRSPRCWAVRSSSPGAGRPA